MSFQIEFSPESQLAFTYLPNEHLTTVLRITNKNEFPIVFKFKASTVNKFIIRPNQSCLKAGQSQEVKIILHKDGVSNYENEKIQVIYGKNYEQTQFKLFSLFVDNYSKTDRLNLTMLVQQKQSRIQNLQKQLKNYPQITRSVQSAPKKKKSMISTMIIVLIVGFLCGFFAPVRLFRKHHSTTLSQQQY